MGRGKDIESLLLGVGQAQNLHPGKTIFLDNAGHHLFWSGVYDSPFSLVGAGKTKLTPESAAKLIPKPGLFDAADYTLEPAAVAALLRGGLAEVYELRNRRLTRKIEVANPAYASFLGPEWHRADGAFRWMPGRATARLDGAGMEVAIRGLCVAEQLEGTSRLTVAATWNGRPLGEQYLTRCGHAVTLAFALPAERAVSGTLLIEVAPVKPIGGDDRELAWAVDRIELR